MTDVSILPLHYRSRQTEQQSHMCDMNLELTYWLFHRSSEECSEVHWSFKCLDCHGQHKEDRWNQWPKHTSGKDHWGLVLAAAVVRITIHVTIHVKVILKHFSFTGQTSPHLSLWKNHHHHNYPCSPGRIPNTPKICQYQRILHHCQCMMMAGVIFHQVFKGHTVNSLVWKDWKCCKGIFLGHHSSYRELDYQYTPGFCGQWWWLHKPCHLWRWWKQHGKSAEWACLNIILLLHLYW